MSEMNLYKSRGRPTKAITEERDKVVAELLMQGKSRTEITRYCKDVFGYAESSISRQILRANKYIRENYKEDPETVVNKHMAMYYNIYRDWKDIDGKTAIQALNSIEKLLKLHSPETLVQHNSLNLNLDKLSINDLKELLKNNE